MPEYCQRACQRDGSATHVAYSQNFTVHTKRTNMTPVRPHPQQSTPGTAHTHTRHSAHTTKVTALTWIWNWMCGNMPCGVCARAARRDADESHHTSP
eukprot:106407-Prymnesium_polylepis.2